MASNKQRLRFSKNPLLTEVTGALDSIKPEWGAVASMVRESVAYETRENGADDLSLWSEFHLIDSLRYLTAGYHTDRALNEDILLGRETRNYRLKLVADHMVLEERRMRGMFFKVAEYDDLYVFDGLPVVFELTLGESQILMRDKFSPNTISKKVDPLARFFGTDEFGYVLVLSPKVINPGSRTQQNFRRHGGIIVPFYTDQEGFREDVEMVGKSFLETL